MLKIAEHLISAFGPKLCLVWWLLIVVNDWQAVLVTCILLTRVNFYCVVVFCNYQHLNEWGPISADSIKRSFRPILLIMSRYIKDMALPLGSPLPARNWKWKSIFKTIASYIFFVLNVLWHIRCYVGLEPMGLFWPHEIRNYHISWKAENCLDPDHSTINILVSCIIMHQMV